MSIAAEAAPTGVGAGFRDFNAAGTQRLSAFNAVIPANAGIQRLSPVDSVIPANAGSGDRQPAGLLDLGRSSVHDGKTLDPRVRGDDDAYGDDDAWEDADDSKEDRVCKKEDRVCREDDVCRNGAGEAAVTTANTTIAQVRSHAA